MNNLERPRMVIDFETFSELDVTKVGAACYAQHPSTEVLCMSYKRIGQPAKIWNPSLPFPQEIYDHYENGGVFEAHNAMFEYAIWLYVLFQRMGIKIMPTRWIDTLAVCAYRSLPMKLDMVGEVLGLSIQKDKRGKYLLQKLCKPRKPTKNDPSTRVNDWALFEELMEYCLTDSNSEECLGLTIGDLSLPEYRLWVLDQLINWRGVQIDLEAVNAAKKITDIVSENLIAELKVITNGEVDKGGQIAKIVEWINQNGEGFFLENLQKGTLDEVLENDDMPNNVRRVLQIRQQLSRASTKKLEKMLECVCSDGSIKGLLQYHGAGTGRWAGRLVQPQNFPRGTIKDMDGLIEVIKTGMPELLEMIYGDPMEAVSSALRGMFVSRPGKVFMVSDFSAIEARVVMWVAQQLDALEAFRAYDRGEGPDIYCVMAGHLYQRLINKKEDPDERQLGKITVLGCFGPKTLVLTDSGVKAILDITIDDRLWDGEKWVEHEGLIYQGEKKVIELVGVEMTPDHEILVQNKWQTAQKVAQNENMIYQALEQGSENLPSLDRHIIQQEGSNISSFNVLVGLIHIMYGCITSLKRKVQDVIHALKNNLDIGEKNTLDMLILFLKRIIGLDFLTESHPVLVDATTQTTMPLNTMALEEYRYVKNGDKIEKNFSNILKLWKGGMILHWSWIGKTWTRVMNLKTLGSLTNLLTCPIKEMFKDYKKEYKNLNPVYDIANVGSLNRFTIITNKGPMLVHNCGYQMSGDTLRQQAKDDYKLDLTKETADWMVSTYRESYPRVKSLWYGLDDAAIQTVRTRKPHSYSYIRYELVEDNAGIWLACVLPNGRRLWYYNPQVEEVYIIPRDPNKNPFYKNSLSYEGRDNKRGGMWGRVRTYGGMLTENVVQAISRDLMAEAMIRVEQLGYPIILTVHDEIIAEPDKDHGSLEEFEKLMSMPAPWAQNCPVSVEGWVGTRYRKG